MFRPPMLGNEYNWLITITPQAKGSPRVQLSSGALLTLGVGAFCLLCVVLQIPAALAAF